MKEESEVLLTFMFDEEQARMQEEFPPVSKHCSRLYPSFPAPIK